MSGKRGERCEGQLAVLDAIVFFSAAILVSSILLSYSLDAHQGTELAPARDPANVLEVFLKASIGMEVVLDLGERVVIRDDDQISESLNLEISALSQGVPLIAFLPLNRLFASALDRLCDVSLHYHLAVLNGTSDEILEIGVDIDEGCRDTFASSLTMPDVHGVDYLVILSIFAVGS